MKNASANAWICTVCGYIHYGPKPPDECPICGAASSLFNPYKETEELTESQESAQWRCLNCEYIHDGSEPPAFCPVCGASHDRFEPYSSVADYSPLEDSKRKIVIAGAGIAGVSAAEAIRKSSPGSEIILLSKEDCLPYYRLNLTRYLAGEIEADSLDLHPDAWYAEQQIDLRLNAELKSIDPAQKRYALRNGEEDDFNTMILAVGSHPFVPPFPGTNKENVTVLRTRAHADSILDFCCEGMQCVCIGGGILGLETAGALARRGVKVTLLEGFDWLLTRQLNQRAGELLHSFVSSTGIKVHTSARVEELVGDEHVHGVLLNDGTTIPADMVLITAGVRSNSYLARMAGLTVNNGIVVNDNLASSHLDIFAAGDVAEHRGVSYGLWGASQFQGTIAGRNAVGEKTDFAGIPRSNMLKVLGYDLFSIGSITMEDGSYESIDGEIDGNYYCFIFHDSRLVGAILLGDTSLSAIVKKTVEENHDCSSILRLKPEVKDLVKYFSDMATQ